MRKKPRLLNNFPTLFSPLLSIGCFVAAGVLAVSSAAADEVFKPTKAISLPAGQSVVSFDISYVDPLLGLYILGDRTNKAVDVIDTATNTVLVQLGKGSFTGIYGEKSIPGIKLHAGFTRAGDALTAVVAGGGLKIEGLTISGDDAAITADLTDTFAALNRARHACVTVTGNCIPPCS